jgi:hypothetical protein
VSDNQLILAFYAAILHFLGDWPLAISGWPLAISEGFQVGGKGDWIPIYPSPLILSHKGRGDLRKGTLIRELFQNLRLKRELFFFVIFLDETMQINPQKSASNCFDEKWRKSIFNVRKTMIWGLKSQGKLPVGEMYPSP